MANIAPQLRTLVKADVNYAKLFHWLAGYKKNMSESTADLVTAKTDIAAPVIRTFFEQLEKLGCGEFKLGRHGNKTRFVWRAPMTTVAAFAIGSNDTKGKTFDPGQDTLWVGDAESDIDDEVRTGRRTYVFPLPGGRSAKLQVMLPLSDEDIRRLHMHVDSLVN